MRSDTEPLVATTDLDSDYEVLGELGRGATAVVYRARDRELGRDVAIKVIRPKFADDEETVARLAREARTVAQLQHPSIVTLYAVRRLRDGGLALVMQLVPGRTLRDILNDRGPLTFERVDRVLRDVAAALGHAHHRGIVHRDVKPENIFIDETTGRALLSDFGVARSLEPDSRLTATGTAIGTPSYMSPEQIDGTELDGRSDVYSLGLVGWEMLTGRRPWDGESLYSVIYKQKREELPALDELRPDTPDRLVYLVEGATRKAPSDRWASADQFLEQASMIAPEGGWARWHAERRKRRRAVVYAAARERGDSVVSAALETMRFRRDDVGAVEPSVAASPAPSDRGSELASIERRAPEQPPGGRRTALVSVLAVAAVAVAMVVGGARLIRGRSAPAASPPTSTTFADNGGVEVRVAPPVSMPNASVPRPAQADSGLAARTAAPPPPAPDTAVQRTEPSRSAEREPRRDATAPAASPATSPKPPVTRSRGATLPVAAAAVATNSARAGSSTSAPAPTATSVAAPTSGDRPAAPAAPVAPVALAPERGVVAAGGRHSCALDEAGAALCWGANDQGQLGDGTREDHVGPAVVAGGLAFAQVSAGTSHTCAVTRDGDVYCWGNNEQGQLGDATTLPRDTPVRVSAGGPFRLVRAGFNHSCALSRAGTVHCWGSNAYGQLGTSGGLTRSTPAPVSGTSFGTIAVGWNHTCGITSAGELFCWGSNNAGQLGDGSRNDQRTPTRVVATTRFVAVAAGNQHTCAVGADAAVYCWGRNTFGQLGTGAGDRVVPTRVEAEAAFSTVTAGAVHTCARTVGSQVYCWGRNTFGQLGDGTTADHSSPVRVTGLPGVAAVQASGAHTCAATTAGDRYCWGYNIEGQLGDGTRNHRSRPVRAASPSR